MNILVMGAGAIGSVAGGLLAKAGHRVSLVGREHHINAIRHKGLFINGVLGKHSITIHNGYLHPTEVPRQHLDIVLITTKAYDTETATLQVLPLLDENSLVVSLQNGLGNLESIASCVGENRTVGGRVMYGAVLAAPGKVEVTTFGDDLVFGSPSGTIPISRLKSIADSFRDAGLPSSVSENIIAFLWGKLLYNCCLNPLSALLGVNYGKLGDSSYTRTIMTDVIKEIFTVAGCLKLTLLWSSPEEYEKVLFEQLIPRTSNHFASMYSDLRSGKRTEIEALNGAVWRLGRANGVPVSTNACLTLMIKAKYVLTSPQG